MKKICIMLAFIMILPVFAISCGNNTDKKHDNTDPDGIHTPENHGTLSEATSGAVTSDPETKTTQKGTNIESSATSGDTAAEASESEVTPSGSETEPDEPSESTAPTEPTMPDESTVPVESETKPAATTESETESSEPEITVPPHMHSFGSYKNSGRLTSDGKEIWIASCICGATKEDYRAVAPKHPLSGKKIIFIGNSLIYHGGCVIPGQARQNDYGYFYQLCKVNGADVTVTDCTYGNHQLYDFVTTDKTAGGRNCPGIGKDLLGGLDLGSYDYVIMSEAGNYFGESSANGSTVQSFRAIKKRFTDAGSNAKFVYLIHSHAYTKGTPYYKESLVQAEALKKEGVIIVNWGALIYDLYKGTAKISGSSIKYAKSTFINTVDGHHPNPLSGYVTAQMVYCAITGESAKGQPYSFCDKIYGFNSYIKSYYGNDSSKTNFPAVFASKTDMDGIHLLMDEYIRKYNIVSCSHEFISNGKLIFRGCSNTYDDYEAICRLCGKEGSIHVSKTGSTDGRKDIMFISPETIRAAGQVSVTTYMKAKKGDVFFRGSISKCDNQWGRAGYSSIMGMASVCDGERSSEKSSDGSVLMWKIKNKSTLYDADAKQGTEGAKYCSLIGYEYASNHKVNGFTLFTDDQSKALTGFDIIGGYKDESGNITWKVLWSGTGLAGKYLKYDDTTCYITADFEETEINCIQIGITSASATAIYISEFEVYESTAAGK